MELRARQINTGDAAIDRAGLDRPLRTYPGRNRTKADVRVVRSAGRELAVKDYAPRPWWIRQTLGRFLIAREVRAYRAADGAPGLPEFAGRRGPFALATVHVDASPLPAGLTGVSAEVLDRVETIVAGLHSRGIAVGDLHRRNVLLGRCGEVYLIDLAAAWVAAPDASRFRQWMFARFRDADRVALARLRARVDGTDPAEAAASVGESAARWDRRMRRVKRLRDRLRGR